MNKIKKAISLIMAAVLLIAIVPTAAFASGAQTLYNILMQPAIKGYFNASTSGNSVVVRENVYYVPATGKVYETRPNQECIWKPARIATYSNSRITYGDYYANIYEFSAGGYAIAEDISHEMGVIDILGNAVVPFGKYVFIESISSDGYAIVDRDGEWFILNIKTGAELDFNIDGAIGYSYGYVCVREFGDDYQSLYHFENIGGENVFGKTYSYASEFENGYATVKTVGSDVYEIIDTSGKTVVAAPANFLPGDVSEEGIFSIESFDHNSFGYMNLQGKQIYPSSLIGGRMFKNGFAVVYNQKGYGLIGANGKVIIPFGEYGALTDVSSTNLVWAGGVSDNPKNVLRVQQGAELEPGVAEIVSLTPENGAKDVGYDESKVPVFKIRFDRAVAGKSEDPYLADVDLYSQQAFSIYRAADDKLVYKPSRYSQADFQLSMDKLELSIKPINRKCFLDPGTEYYIVMGKDFIRFADGSSSPTIAKGDWRFKTDTDGVSFRYATTFDKDSTYSGIKYDDQWFFGNPYQYNHDLATTSLGFAMSGFGSKAGTPKDKNVCAFLSNLGFDNDHYYSRGYDADDNGTVAFAVSTKEISSGSGETAMLLAICLRGAGYGNGGWTGNFDVGNGGAYHSGFYKASKYVENEIKNYIKEHNINSDRMRIWITGYSRSAAVANLLSAGLSTDKVCDKERIFTYTFATPNNQIILFETPHRNIFNIVNPNDIVPFVPLSQWGFGKMGTSYILPSTVQGHMRTEYTDAVYSKFEEITGGEVQYMTPGNIETTHAWIRYAGGNAVTNRLTFYEYLQTPLMEFESGNDRAFDGFLKGVTTTEELLELFKNENYIKIATELYSVIEETKKTDPYSPLLPLVSELYKVAKGAASEMIRGKSTTNIGIIMALYDIVVHRFSSGLLKEHWPEAYLAWMTEITEEDLTRTNEFVSKTAIIRCPVDVVIYDQNNNIVAQVIDNDVLDIEDSPVAAAVFGEEDKLFVLPNDQNYRIEITATDVGTMDYTIIENLADGSVARTVEFYDVDLYTDDVFTGNIDDIQYTDSENYALWKNQNTVIRHDYDSYAYPISGDESGDNHDIFNIEVDEPDNGDVTVSNESVESGGTVKVTVTPFAGYTLDSLTITASNGNVVNAESADDGTYTFTMPASDVAVKATFKKLPVPFTDVPLDAWYYDIVWYTYYNGLFYGKADKIFAPDDTATRAEVAMVLWRIDDCAQANLHLSYPDVSENKWYTEAVRWATAAHVVYGYDDGCFGTDDPVTREQFATMLYRLAGYLNMDLNTPSDVLAKFPDAGQVRDWAKDAMAWAVDRGIIVGSDGKLNPQGNALRAQLAAMMERFAKLK